jgi:hypothetical protein
MDRADLDKIEVSGTDAPAVQAETNSNDTTPNPQPATEKKVDEGTDKASDKGDGSEKPVADKTGDEKAADDEGKDKKGDDGERKPNRADRKWDRLQKKNAELAYENKLLREGKLTAGGDKQTEQRQAPTDRPKRADYQNPDDYDDALAAYLDNKVTEAREEGRRLAHSERKAQEISQKIEAFKKEHADYDAKVKELDDLTLSEAMFSLVRKEKNPAAIAYYFANHQDEAERINGLPPVEISHELGRISVIVEANASPAAEKKPAISKAPRPVPDAEPGKSDNHEETDAEYAMRYKKRKGLIPA